MDQADRRARPPIRCLRPIFPATAAAGPRGPAETLAEEVAHLGTAIDRIEGPIHLVGHSYGGAIAFKIATASPFAGRVRSLTLIEPVLPTLLKENPADRRLHDLFAQLARNVSADLWNGMYMEAVDRFTVLLEWIGTRRTALRRGAAAHDRTRREDRLRFHRGAFGRKRHVGRGRDRACQRCCCRADCHPTSPSVSSAGSPRSLRAPTRITSPRPATCCH